MIDTDSILTSTKKLLGLTEEYEPFDDDITIYINSALSTLTQLGIGPAQGFRIKDEKAKWSEYLGDDPRLEFVREYVYLKVKMVFDPPISTSVLDAYNKIISELEWRICHHNDMNSNA